MEDVLSTYELPYNEDYPQVCLDEKLVTLHADVVDRVPVQPGHPERVDYEYERVGTANLFVMVERLTGYRHVEVTERRTAVDYAWRLKWLADIRYPNAKKIRLVQDNLNTHRIVLLDTGLKREEVTEVMISYKIHGIISPETDLELFKKALSVIESGEVWFNNATMKEFIQNAGQRNVSRDTETVTEREQEIMRNVCQGYRNREIANRLCLSEQTVKAHLNRIYKKLHVSSRSQLAALAITTQLFPSGSVSSMHK